MTATATSGAEAAQVATYQMRIGPDWTEALDGGRFETSNPFSGQAWASVPNAGAADVDRAVTAASEALAGPWGAMTGVDRARLMSALADLLDRDAERLAVLESTDNGKLLRETSGQTKSLAAWLRYFAGLADKLEGTVIPAANPDFFIYTRPEPVGVVAAIAPWNSPLSLLVWKLAPALAAGCTLVVKPSEYTPVTALELAALTVEAGFPPGVVNVVTGNTADLGRALVQHAGVRHVAFTGSPAVGIEVAKGAASHLARTTLELGGKSAQVVFADADLDRAVTGIIAGIFAASGQTCIAGSRLLVDHRIHGELLDRLAARVDQIRLGDPMETTTEMGPLANAAQLVTVSSMVERAVADGASVRCGGTVDPDLGGLFFRPTILDGVTPGSEIEQCEVFGPVLAVIGFEDEGEAVRVANDTRYALGAGVWTSDVQRAHRVAHQLRAGTVWVNCYRLVAPNVPFGGSGYSGWGRESGLEAVREYLETKAVWVDVVGAARDPFRIG